MASLLQRTIIQKLLLGTAFAILLVAVIVQGTMLSGQGRRLSALEEQARDLQRQTLRIEEILTRRPARSLEEVARDVDAIRRDMAEAQTQNLRVAEAILGSRGPVRSLGKVARDVNAVRRDMAESREAVRRTR
jgi:hypothetical protein